jgi:hypothetical protein
MPACALIFFEDVTPRVIAPMEEMNWIAVINN